MNIIDKEPVLRAKKALKDFDGSLDEPKFLPSLIPNILVNGSSGIAVGMSTDIPPHNLGEIILAVQHLIKNPKCSVKDLIDFIPAPDLSLIHI